MGRSRDNDHDSIAEGSERSETSSASGTEVAGPGSEILKETKVILLSRLAVGVILLITAAIAGVTTYLVTSREQVRDFQAQFDEYAREVIDGSDDALSNVVTSINTMSLTMTAFAQSQGTQWPFYTHPDFEVLGNSLREISGAQLVSWSPIVDGFEKRNLWETYSNANKKWVDDGLAWIATKEGQAHPEGPHDIPSHIYSRNSVGQTVNEEGSGPFAPVWQMAAAPNDTSIVNFDLMSDAVYERCLKTAKEINGAILSEVVDARSLYGTASIADPAKELADPQSLVLTPIYDGHSAETSFVVGAVTAVLSWDVFFKNVLHEDIKAMYVVVDDGLCGNEFTYRIEGQEAIYLGEGSLVEANMAQYSTSAPFAEFLPPDNSGSVDCVYSMTLYPSQAMYDDFQSHTPLFLTVAVAAIFCITAIIFGGYDCVVQARQQKVMNNAARSNAIVSSLFPAEIRDRLFGNEDPKNKNKEIVSSLPESSKFRLKSYLADEESPKDDGDDPDKKTSSEMPVHPKVDMYETKPIADLFPHTTVMFGDIAGFTAWSSVREPSQVFVLLETVYSAFDAIAKRRRVFKVETVGDCYVAVTGLPEARKDHALVMARFARECLDKFNELAKALEIKLGPDTGDLAMRIGLHSGPVTAGVLRGDKSRFQLFGDTVNTAARVESTGQRNRIHLSNDTAELLVAGGKAHWCKKREGTVNAKGKGDMQTFWLQTKEESEAGQAAKEEGKEDAPQNDAAALNHKLRDSTMAELEETLPPKVKRLVGWNVEILKKLLQQIVAKRNACANKKINEQQLGAREKTIGRGMYLLDEVVEIIALPKFDSNAQKLQENPNKIELPEQVVTQLRHYVSAIAAMYRDNSFHNFEHASHVTMSVSKLLSRIVAPDELMNSADKDLASSLHDHTYGITSDPLTQFAVVLSALIHDVDHFGVSNFQLIKEDHKLARFFKQKSVAEQNSIVLAWEKLMSNHFTELRRFIYQDTHELERFRQLMVNTVLATDIFDKELSALRKNRWETAFSKSAERHANEDEHVNRKATIVIEHLIQASDVAHTMQHWHIYQKWNERLFSEMTVAFKAGRMGSNPADGWYQGELGFFDNYVIPLAKKLKDCGVFGVSSDEYLNYAMENRREWATKGEEVVAKMIEKYNPKKEEEEKKDEPQAKPESAPAEAPLSKVVGDKKPEEPQNADVQTTATESSASDSS